MKNKKQILISIGLVVVYIAVLIAWHCYDPTDNFKLAMPGADNRPQATARKADDVIIGEFFMKEEQTPNSNPSTLNSKLSPHAGGFRGSWPCFRGSNHDNIASNANGMSLMKDAFKEMWTLKTGEGHASPVISQGKAYVLDYDEQLSSDALRCIDLITGKQLWKRWYRVPMKRNHGFSRTIPAIYQNHVVSIGPEGHVMCCDKETGEMQWSIDMKKRFATEIPFWYTGQCPLIDNGTLVLAPAGKDTLMLGVDIETGKTLWATPNSPHLKMSHSSVMPMTLGGTRTYVYIGVGGVCGVSAEKGSIGKMLWNTSKWQPSVVAPSPLQISDNQIFLVAGYGAGGALLQVDKRGTGWSATIKDSYKASAGMSSEQQTPIRYKGTLITILPKDGGGMRERLAMYSPDNLHSPIWTSAANERFGLGPYLIIDDKLFAFKEDGELYVYSVGAKSMTLLRKQRVMEEGIDAWGPIAYADGYIIVRDSKTIKCLKVFE